MTDSLTTAAPETVPGGGCGCSEGDRAATELSRRRILAAAGAMGAGGALAGVVGDGIATQYAFAGPAYRGDVVVVLSLRGGMDGLSAVAPVGDHHYAKARPTIAVPASHGIKLDRMFALHPALAPLKPLWQRKQLALVHAVGQQDASRSHFADMERMENAAPGSHLRTGWLDRMVGLTNPSTFGAVAMGSAMVPSSLMGSHPALAVGSIADFGLYGATKGTEFTRWTKALTTLHHGHSPVSASAMTGLHAAKTSRAMSAGATPQTLASAHYPATVLGQSLHDVARLVKSKVGLRVATVDVGDWDMHVGQGRSDHGWMHDQLADFGKALAAFATDLGSAMNGVTLVTLSEFGRRVAENGSGGTDHGHGNVCFVLGGGIRGGKVYGRWPGLAADKLDQGDLAGTTDYRTVLAEILQKRAKVSTTSVFPDFKAHALGLAVTKS